MPLAVTVETLSSKLQVLSMSLTRKTCEMLNDVLCYDWRNNKFGLNLAVLQYAYVSVIYRSISTWPRKERRWMSNFRANFLKKWQLVSNFSGNLEQLFQTFWATCGQGNSINKYHDIKWQPMLKSLSSMHFSWESLCNKLYAIIIRCPRNSIRKNCLGNYRNLFMKNCL